MQLPCHHSKADVSKGTLPFWQISPVFYQPTAELLWRGSKKLTVVDS
jgi:hypothetical protein